MSVPLYYERPFLIKLKYRGIRDHYFSSNSCLYIIFRDIAKYNTEDDLEESIEETGWKLVHGDVFRPPNHSRIFAAVIGSGIQLFCMMAITIFFAMLGMLSPASRGALLTASIFVYEFMGLVAGYFAGRLYKTLKGKVNQKRNQ